MGGTRTTTPTTSKPAANDSPILQLLCVSAKVRDVQKWLGDPGFKTHVDSILVESQRQV